ncbi:hypothetical protein [Pantoea sp. BAV 3049]|uniref:hypothetical protein n=1 Tax=Pantoea sp. BAV 3049 TaxID=2654188 RepID=UPI00131B06CC|nr:hypothetical protein [Pantoea sp. BAV 3049]
MKNELISVWYRVTFMVTENGDRREHSIFTQGNSEAGAAVSAAVGICESNNGLSNPTFKSIRVATYGEQDSIEAEMEAIDEREAKELKEEDDE